MKKVQIRSNNERYCTVKRDNEDEEKNPRMYAGLLSR